MNPNYVAIIKQDIDKLLAIEFIQLIEKAIWLSSIVIFLKKNDKLWICVSFSKLNVTIKKLLIPFGVKNGPPIY